jgi:hypothetical protein
VISTATGSGECYYEVTLSSAQLVSGSYTFTMKLKTATTTGWKLEAYTVGVTTYTANTSSLVKVDTNLVAKLQVLILPEESPVPGDTANRGRKGIISSKVAGTPFNVEIRRVDSCWNLVTDDNPPVWVTSNDPYKVSLATATLVNGTTTWSVTLVTAGSGRKIYVDKTGYIGDYSTAFTVDENEDKCLQILLQGEVLKEGDIANRGRDSSGIVNPQTAGIAFPVTVNRVDSCWNLVSENLPGVGVTSDDPYGEPSNTTPRYVDLTNGTSTFYVVMRRAQNVKFYVGKTGYTGDDSTQITTVPNSTIKKLQVVIEGESPQPGDIANNGKSGQPITPQAGQPFNLTVRSVDNCWNLTNKTPWVRLTSDDPKADNPLVSDFQLVGGTKVVSVTLKQSTTTGWKITATATDYQDGVSSLVKVNPIEADHLLVSISTTVTAGVAQDVAVEVLDKFNNRSTGYNGTIRFESNDPHGTLPGDYTFTTGVGGDNGYKVFYSTVVLRSQGTWYVKAYDVNYSTITGQKNVTVSPNVAKKLLVLLPGELRDAGSDPQGTGKKSGYPPLDWTAGVSTGVVVNLVDDWWNINSTASQPWVVISTATGSGECYYEVTLSSAQLVSGSYTFTMKLKTATTTGWKLEAYTLGVTTYTANTSSLVKVNPNSSEKYLQVLLPGEEPMPGNTQNKGRKGTPDFNSSSPGYQNATAGTSFNIIVRKVDSSWNLLKSDLSGVQITSTDPNVPAPGSVDLTFGVGIATITLQTIGAGRTITVSQSAQGYTPDTSTPFTVDPSTYPCLQVLLPGESPDGGNLTTRGRSGTPDFDSNTPGVQDATAGTPFNITIRRVDNYWNFVTGEVADVSITSNDPYAQFLGTATLTGGTTTWSVVLKKATSGRTISVSKSGYSSDTSTSFTVNPSTHQCLQVLLPGEANDAGNESNRGRTSPQSIELTAGTTFYITVKTVDKYWNLTKPDFDILVTVTSNDPTKPNLGTVAVSKTTGEGILSVVLYRGIENGRTITVSRTDYQSDTSTAFTVKPGETTKLLVLVPNEDVSPGTETGRTGTVEDWTAGDYRPVTVMTVDANWNPTGETIVLDKVYTNDNYSYPETNPITNITLTNGTSTFMMVFVSKGTRHIIADDDEYIDNTSSNITVIPNDPVKLQVLVPGEVGVEGHPNGKLDVLPSTRTAGVAFPVTVNSVDQNWNISCSTRTIQLITNDDNAPPISNQQLVNGTTVFMVTLITAKQSWIKAIDTTPTDKLLENQSPDIPVATNPNQYNLLMLLEGESPAPGTSTGKTGTVTPPTAGAPYAVTVRACDNYWNLNTSGTPQVRVTTSNDPYAILPSTANLIGGTTTFFVTFKLANTTWTITATDIDGQPPLWKAYTTQQVPVQPASAVKLQVLAYPEVPLPGSSPTGPGKSGTPDWHVAGSSFNVTVNAVDNYWNIVSTNPSVSVVTTDPYDNHPLAKQLDNGTNTFKIEMVTRGSWAIIAQADGYQAGSSTVTIKSGNATRLQVLLPGETAKEGKWNQLPYGKEGTPDYWVAGSTFNVTINAVDDYWNRVSTITYVTVTTPNDPNDNESTYSGSLNSQGTMVSVIKMVTAGTNSVKAEAFGLATSTSTTIINPAGAAYFKVQVTPQSGVAGETRNITITAYDGWKSWDPITRTGEGNIADGGTDPNKAYQGTISFSCNDPYPAGLPGEITFTPLDKGTTTLFNQTVLYTAGSWWIEATDISTASIYGRQENISVSPAPAYRFVVSPKNSQDVPAGSYQAISAYLSDFYGNQTPEANKPCALTITDVVGSPGYLTITSTTTNSNGEIGPIEYYVSTTAGHKATITVTTGTVTGKSALITTIGGNPNYLVFIGTPPATLVAGNVTSQPFAVQRYDQYGNITNITKTTVYLKSSSTGAKKSFRYPQGTILTSSQPGVDGEINIYGGQNTAYFYYYDEKASWDEITLDTFTITVSLDTNFGNSDDDTTPLRVDPDAVVNKLAFTSSPQTFTAGTPSGLITIQTQDVFSNPKKVSSDTRINLYSLSIGTNSFSVNVDTWTPITYVTISTNTYQQSFYYKDTKSGSQTLKVDEDDSYQYGWLPGFQNQTVLPDRITKLAFTTPAYTSSQPLIAGATSWTMTVEMQDQFDNPSRFLTVGNPLSSNTKLLLISQPSGQYGFSISSTVWSPTTEAWIVVGSTRTSFYYKNFKSGTWGITVKSQDYAWTDALQDESVVGANVGKIVFISPEPKFIAGTCSSTMTIQTQDLYGNVAPVEQATEISLLSTSPKGADFSWDGQTWGRTTVTIGQGQTSANFFYTDKVAGNTNIVTAMAPPEKGWIAGTTPVTVTPSHAVAFRVSHDGAASVNVLETISVQALDEFGNDATGPPNDNPPYDAPEFQATYYTGTATFTVTGNAKIEDPASASYSFTKADRGFTTFKISDDYVEKVQMTAKDAEDPMITGTSTDLSVCGIKVTPISLAPLNIFQGEGILENKKSVAMLRMDIQANPDAPPQADEAVWTDLKIYRIGDARDGDVPKVVLWKDGTSGTIGEFDAPLPPDNYTLGVPSPYDIPLAVGSFTGETGIVTLSLGARAQTLDKSLQRYFLTVNVSTTAVAERKFGIEIQKPGDFTLVFPEVQIGKDNFAIRTTSSTIQTAPAQMQVTPYNLVYSTGTVQQGTKNLAMVRVVLATDRFTAKWTKIKINRKGTGFDSDVEEVKIYRDREPYGTFEPAVDTLISSGINKFEGGQVLINIDSDNVTTGDQPEEITSTPQNYFIVFSIHDSATVGSTVGAECGVGSFWVESPATVNQEPFESGKPTITATEDNLIVAGGAPGGSVNVAPAELVQGTTNQAMLHFKLSSDAHTVLWDKLRVDLIGAGTHSDVAKVKVFKWNSGAVDAYGRPVIDFDGPDNDLITYADNDIQIGWAIFTSTTTLIQISNPITGKNYEEITTTPKNYLVVLDVDVLAKPQDDALGLRVSSSTYFSVLGVDSVSEAGFPRYSSKSRVVEYADTITVVPKSIAPTTGMQGSGDPDPTNPADPPVPILQLDLSVNQSDSIWTDIRIDRTGTAEDSEVTSVTVWKDNPLVGDIGNFDTVNDILISTPTKVFLGKTANIHLATEQRITVSPQRYFLAYGISDVAIPGNTVGAKIVEGAYITVKNPNETVQFTVLPATSTLVQIYPKPRTLTVEGIDRAGVYTTLSGPVSSTSTVITVDSTLTFLPSGYIRIDNEIIRYTGKTDTTFEGVTRGASGSQPASHSAGAQVYKYFFQNDKDIWMASLKMISNSPYPVGVGWKGLRLILTGTGLHTDISTVKVWKDNNNNQILDGMDILIASATFSGADVSIQFPTQYVYDDYQYYFLTFSLSGSATPDALVGLKIDGANDIYQISPHLVNGGFPILSSEIRVHPTRDELITSFTDISGAAVPLIQGNKNVGMLKMTLSSNENTVIWDRLRVKRTGTGTDSDVSTVKIYRDEAPYEGTFQSGNDTLITTGVNTFIDTLADISLLQPEVIGTTPRSYFVVLDIYQLAKVGKSIGVAISSATYFTVQGVDIVRPVNFASTNLVVNEYADTITVTPLESTQTPTQIVQGAENVPMHKFTLKTNQSDALWTGVKVRRTGTPLSKDSDVERVKIYRDLDNNGLFSPTSDVQISISTITYKFTDQAVNIYFGTPQVIGTAPQTYFLVYDIAVDATLNEQVGAMFDGPACFFFPVPPNNVDNPVSADLGPGYWDVTTPLGKFPFESPKVAVKTLELNLIAQDMAPGGARQKEKDVLMERLALSVNMNRAEWNILTIEEMDTAQDSDFALVKLYRDADGDGVFTSGKEVLIGTGTFSQGIANIVIDGDPAPGIQPELIRTTTSYYFVALDISEQAVPGNKILLQLTTEDFIDIKPSTIKRNYTAPIRTSVTRVRDYRTPTRPVVYAEEWTNDASKMSAKWESESPLGVIDSYYAVGTAPGGADRTNNQWLYAGERKEVTVSGLTLQQYRPQDSGPVYYFSVIARSVSGEVTLFSDPGYRPFKVDITPPTKVAPPVPEISAEAGATSYNVHWDFANDPESGVVAYELQERADTSPLWETISNTIPGDSQNYSVTGKEKGHFYFYRVRAKNAAGSWGEWSDASLPAVTGLPKDIIGDVSNYPNPARGDKTTIAYTLKYDAKVIIEIYDLLGYPVLREELKPGIKEKSAQGPCQWDWYLTNERGDKVAKGGYICRITVDVEDSRATKAEDRTVQVIRKIGVIR